MTTWNVQRSSYFYSDGANSPEKCVGTIAAHVRSMTTARRFEDLVAWQLSEELKEEVFRLTSRPSVARDVDFCDDIQRSARSAPANISEGFGWYEPKPNARHVSIAKASLDETKNHILDGFKRRHFDLAERDNLLNLQERARMATTRYLRYLTSCKRAPEGKPYEPRSLAKPIADPRSQGKPEQPNDAAQRVAGRHNLERTEPDTNAGQSKKPEQEVDAKNVETNRLVPKSWEYKIVERKNPEPEHPEPKNLRNQNLRNVGNFGTRGPS